MKTTWIIHWLDREGIPRRAEYTDKDAAESLVDWLDDEGRRGIRVEVVER